MDSQIGSGVMKLMRMRLYSLTRDLHSYVGMFLSPFVLVFAASVVLLNHPGLPLGGSDRTHTWTAKFNLPPGMESMDLPHRVSVARQVLDRAGISGEIGYVDYSADRGRLSIPVSRPGYEASVIWMRDNGLATFQERKTGFGDSLIFLHKMPGPHLASIRPNWKVTRAWGWMADGTAWLVLFLSVTGICLWVALRAERRIGLIMIAAGAVTFGWAMYAVCN